MIFPLDQERTVLELPVEKPLQQKDQKTSGHRKYLYIA
jgi:hypothetical protein